ncbi:MAG: hypothetical protein EBE86_024600, partial [Hormoscilla sp. GUM202]|nr:hypothetical protein [Hormoscilla sp. GUM202]
ESGFATELYDSFAILYDNWYLIFPQVPYLYLHESSLSGTLPSEYGELNNLRNFWLHGNSMSGMVPSSIRDLSATIKGLEEFDFPHPKGPGYTNKARLRGLYTCIRAAEGSRSVHPAINYL